MPAPKNNQNAKGNAGGYGMPKAYRDKQVALKTLVLDEMIRIMKEGSQGQKMRVIDKVGPRCVPDELELGGSAENPVRLVVVKQTKPHDDRDTAAS